MARNDTTSAVIDSLLKLLVVGGVLSAVMVAPNILQAVNKPLFKYFNRLDKRARERELRRIIIYMRQRGLVTGAYEHGLVITTAGRRRATQVDFDNLAIYRPQKWDKKWRLVIFDIPESRRRARVALTGKLKLLGFQKLQHSVWIHPFPCRDQIVKVCLEYNISHYVSYIETTYIDHQGLLIQRFTKVFNTK